MTLTGSAEAVSLGDRVSYLLPDADVPLPDEDTGVVDGLGEPELEHLQMKNNEINSNRIMTIVLSFIGVSLLTENDAKKENEVTL